MLSRIGGSEEKQETTRAIVCFAGEQYNFCHTFSAGAGLAALVFYVSLLKSRDVNTLSLRLSSNLHSIQVQPRGRGVKSQLQILQLIQRTSDCKSWHHSIRFTVGSRGSFSPMTVFLCFIRTITVALTFLNARSAWRQWKLFTLQWLLLFLDWFMWNTNTCGLK